MSIVRVVAVFFRAMLRPRAVMAAENLALRHQLGVLQRSVRRPRLRQRDRVFWVWLFRLWADWRSGLVIVKPETVIRWHRKGFRLYWRWTSRKKPGRPMIATENPTAHHGTPISDPNIASALPVLARPYDPRKQSSGWR